MKTTRFIPAILLLLTAGAVGTQAAPRAASAEKSARVEVGFFEPEKFTDVKDTNMDSPRNRDYILNELKTHLEQRAKYYLPEGSTLAVTVTDVDLAGEFEPWRTGAASDVRIVKEIYPPRIKLSYRLTDANGEIISQGDRALTNLMFLMTAAPRFILDEPYRFEKALLDDWLRSDLREKRR